MANFSKLVREGLERQTHSVLQHPEADLLSAFAAQTLTRKERAAVLDHLARCADCREVLAFLSAPEHTGAPERAKSPRSHGQLTWWTFRAGALAAAAALVLVVVRWEPVPPPAPKTSAPPISPPPRKVSAPPVAPIEPQKTLLVPQIRSRNSISLPKPPGNEMEPTLSQPVLQETQTAAPVVELPQSIAEPKTAAPPPSAAQSDAVVSESQSLQAEASRDQAARQAFIAGAIPADKSRKAARQGFARSLAVEPLSTIPARKYKIAQPAIEHIWSLSTETGIEAPAGTILSSTDGGLTWRPISVDGQTHIYALSAASPEVWAGGANGALFHSSDDGLHWTRVTVADVAESATGALSSISIRDNSSLTVKTTSEEIWTSVDGGAHWLRTK